MEGYAEKKIPGERLVCVDIVYTDRIERLMITGDFFIHPESCIMEMEKAMAGVPLSMNDMELRDIINNVAESHKAKLIGISAKSIVAAIREATAKKVS